MKKNVFSFCITGIIVFVLLFSLFFAGCDNVATGNEEPGNLVCFGDSLTAGYGATTPKIDDQAKAYPAYLQQKVNIPVINAGRSGDTTAQALARINTGVLSKDPRIVIIEFGANDVFRLISPETTRDNMRKIIKLIDNGNRKIYIAKFYTETVAREMIDTLVPNYDKQTAIIDQYDTMFNTLTESNNVELIDDIWKGVWGIHMSDKLHPNARGYEIMAENYFNAIKPYLEANDLLK
jgi:acyl-CoA thioesterase-1